MFTIPTDKLYKFLATISLIVFIVFLFIPQIASLYFSSVLAQVQMISMRKEKIEQVSLKRLKDIRSADIPKDSVWKALKPVEDGLRVVDSLNSEIKRMGVESEVYRNELNKLFTIRFWILLPAFLLFVLSIMWWLYEDLSESIKERIALFFGKKEK